MIDKMINLRFLLCLSLIFIVVLSSSDFNSKTCGQFKSKASARVIGGGDASIEEFPWQVSLQKITLGNILPIPQWRHICGASIINNNWLLTAAHCVDGLSNAIFPLQLRAVIGTDQWRNAILQPSIQIIPITEIIVHEKWNYDEAKNDIALIRTSRPIVFNDKANSICLAENDLNITDNVMLSGWGMTSDRSLLNRHLPNRLQKIEVPVVEVEKCRDIYKSQDYEITDSMICAGSFRNGYCIGAYSGDSGGALISYIDGRAYQVGIVSFSLPCRRFQAPDVYTKINKYLSWIQERISKI